MKYEWQLMFNNDGIDAQCIVRNPDGTNKIIETLPISDDPKIDWVAAQEEAKIILRMKCTRDLVKKSWSDVQAATYAILNQKWLEPKIIESAKRRWPDQKLAEQWLILGAMLVNNTSYKQWIEKLLPNVEDKDLRSIWKDWPGSDEVKISNALSYLLYISNTSEQGVYCIPEYNHALLTFEGKKLSTTVFNKPSGGEEIWEIWKTEDKYLVRQSFRNGVLETRSPLVKNLNSLEVLSTLEDKWRIHSKHPKLNERILQLATLAQLLNIDRYTILSKLWTTDVNIAHAVLKALYPEKDDAWIDTIMINKTPYEAISAIKELEQS